MNLQRVTTDTPESLKDKIDAIMDFQLTHFGFETSQDGRSSFSRFEFIPFLPEIWAKPIIAKVSILPFENQNSWNVTKAQDVFVFRNDQNLKVVEVKLQRD